MIDLVSPLEGLALDAVQGLSQQETEPIAGSAENSGI